MTALDDVTVEFATGRFTAIMGPSGSGKSTLLHCLAGLDTLTSGQIFIGDVDITALSEKKLTLLRRERLGFIFQSYNLLPTLSAIDNITLPIDIAGAKVDRAWLDHIIDTVGLRPLLKHRPSELSGGQQQRVAAARALASRPAIIFADEPTGNLDSRSSTEFKQQQSKQIDQALNLFIGLLILAVIIAMLGIVNTLALSVFERTRELGLLRAVGMSRWQTREMVMWESVIISVLGALLGVAVGIGFAWALQRALASSGFSVFRIPPVSILVYLALAAVAGVLAAIGPAQRAARMNVLAAIATE